MFHDSRVRQGIPPPYALHLQTCHFN